jgi:putative glycosyltransferase (TIGR04372 family)
MGIGSKPFVCFYARDNKFLQHHFPEDDWSYHNYRDANIDNYVDAVNYLVDRGYYAVRVGKLVSKPFVLVKEGVIDYSTGPWRSDFADLYLLSQCRYFVGQGAGLEAVARLFRKPQVLLNYIPLNLLIAWSKNDLMIFKKLWLKKEKRFMSFREIKDSELGMALGEDVYQRWDVEVVENSPEEIRDAVVEMDERLNGTWQTNDEYEFLQGRFWAMFKPDRWNKVFRARVGSKFLMQNQDLLK